MEVVSFFSRVFGLIFVIMVEFSFNFKVLVEVNTREACIFFNSVIFQIWL